MTPERIILNCDRPGISVKATPALFVAVGMLFAIEAGAANVLTNPGFEAPGLAGWTTFGPNNYSENTPGIAHGGSNFYKAYGAFIGAQNYTGIYQDNLSAPGAIYSADGWAYTLGSDGGGIHGQDAIWLEVSFRDASYNALALYRSTVVTANNLASFGGTNTWFDLPITNQCSFTNASAPILLPGTVTNSVVSLVAPPGTAYVRYQVVFAQGPDNANGSMYFDDLTLNQTGGAPPPATQWNIVWSDEFNSNSINTNIWAFETNNGCPNLCGWGNNELEWYTDRTNNAYESGGLLHIVARQESTNGSSFTSARMKTQGNYNTPVYGRIEWRAAMPAGVGMWPGLWMLGSNIPTAGWPGCGEIDVSETKGTELTTVHGSLHSGSDETAVYTSFASGDSITNFHIYAIDWEPNSISFSVDGNVYETVTSWNDSLGPFPTPFNQPFFLLMNLAVGGNFVDNPSVANIEAGTVFPAEIKVDYLRILEKTAPLQIAVTRSNGNMVLTWPTNIVCHLQVQTNSLTGGNWSDLANTASPVIIAPGQNNACVFYRLESPQFILKPKKDSPKNALSAKEKNVVAERPALKIPRWRLWLFRVFSFLLIPLLVVGGLELGLRLCGYGYPTSFFLKTEIGGADYYVSNDRFGYRFFPPALARTPVPMRMAVKKTANTYRIFVFGESAAMGDPDPTFGAWRYLQVLLHERFPGTDFEVICVAMTAINSHVILPIARECARHDGDLWIVYMGNNEMVGPFGGSTVFGSRVAGIHLIRASLAVKSTKLGELLDGLARQWGHSSAPETWSGLNMFKEHQLRYGDPNRLRAYENFKRNLDDILRAGRDAGVPVIVSTVGSNLKDCAPFGSQHVIGLNDVQKSEWDGLYQEATNLESSGDFSGALKKYQQAATIDPHYAELHFRSGCCQLALTNFEPALSDFELARDDDTLAFRADSRINRIIGDVAEAKANQGVYFLDAFKMLAQSSPAKIPGNELFYEHVHLNFDGNYLLGRAFAEQTLKLLPKSILARGKSEWASAEICDRRLGVSPWDRMRVWQENYSRVSEPPFTDQLNDVPRARFYMAKLQDLNSQLTEHSRAQSRAVYEEALALSPNDYCLRENFAQFLDETGDLTDAPAEEQKVSDLLPQNPMTPCIIGKLLVRLGDPAGAERNFARALAIRKDYVVALNEMGVLLANKQKTDEAAKCFARALRTDPGSVDAYQNRGFMEQNEGNWNQAINDYHAAADRQPNGPADYLYHAVSSLAEHQSNDAFQYFNAAVRMNPNFWQARYVFGRELASAGMVDEAQAQFSAVVRTRPDFPAGHLNNGLALAKSGKLDEALKEFQITLQLNPTNLVARQNLEAIQANIQTSKIRSQ